jgi:hypothetical protein
MGDLRKPFLVLALLVAAAVVLLEVGSGVAVGGHDASAQLLGGAGSLGVDVGDVHHVTQPSGRGIRYLALVDVVVLYTTALYALSLLVPRRIQGRVQGLVTLIGSVLLILAALTLLVAAVVEVLVMVALFTAVPFGTLAYLALWGFFPVGDATALLGLLMFLKLVFGALLVAAQPRFLQNKGLVLLVLTTLACTLLLTFLDRWVPVILVSIVDDVGAIVIAVVAIVWAVVLLVGSIPAIWKAVRVTAAAGAR